MRYINWRKCENSMFKTWRIWENLHKTIEISRKSINLRILVKFSNKIC
ncbi:hypothetical protein HMPREF1573_00915 [Gardnerella vaginalis JCP7276]|nr:hypothetical protein HMPREF1575_00612 [Gardnerella vaginalis JCP7672]EPI56404.1 hypothetical protein HMPREF1573_00915 [Gardnerella vaginalis JCP7276]BAQ33777.1 hypothetical protein GAVG_1125 [Gardnerella vaginalis ATCC 14018 = JCM 11026]